MIKELCLIGLELHIVLLRELFYDFLRQVRLDRVRDGLLEVQRVIYAVEVEELHVQLVDYLANLVCVVTVVALASLDRHLGELHYVFLHILKRYAQLV